MLGAAAAADALPQTFEAATLLRFAAHYVLFVREAFDGEPLASRGEGGGGGGGVTAAGIHGMRTARTSLGDDILHAYSRLLAHKMAIEEVAYYVSHLPPGRRIVAYSDFLLQVCVLVCVCVCVH